MRTENVVLGTNSPPGRPSTWQLRFGKKSTFRLASPKPDVLCPNLGSHARSPSISEQLLRALDTKPKAQEDLSRECVDVLIGRRNAFASEPDLRLRTQPQDAGGEVSTVQKEYGHRNIAAEAKEIIRVRFQIETQADALRQVPGHRKPPKRRSEVTLPSRVGSSKRPTRSGTFSNNTNTRKNYTAPPRSEKNNLQASLMPSKCDNQKAELRPTKDVSRLQRKHQHWPQQKLSSAASSKKSRSPPFPPQQLPMARRQQLPYQACEDRKLQAAEERALLKLRKPGSNDNNKDEIIQEQRRLEKQIERLTLENQQAAALEDRLEHRKARLKFLRRVFDAWHTHVEFKQEQQVRVAAEFNWRAMKLLMTGWKRYTQRQMQTKTAEIIRVKMIREQQLNEQANQFHRLKLLPKWFYQWTAFVTQQKEYYVAAEAATRRRAQSERLMERLQRQQILAKKSQHDSDNQTDSETQNGGLCPQESRSDRATRFRQQRHAWSGIEEYETTRFDSSSQAASTQYPVQVPPPLQFTEYTTLAPVDKVYKAMEQRAAERKLRREMLKRRYVELEQKKQKEQDEQRAAREALLLEQRMEEKERRRERKLAEVLALKEKQERRNHLLAQWQQANKHNRRRLLFYYALLPWRKHNTRIERVARNATRWHELRTVYSHWERWQEFVQRCRKNRRQRQRSQVEQAARHYARSLQRRALWGLTRYHQAIQTRALAVRRQHQWNALQRSWAYWNKRLANERAHERKRICEVTINMQQSKLRRICTQWLKVTSEAKRRQKLQQEKQQLWRKVRGWLDEDD